MCEDGWYQWTGWDGSVMLVFVVQWYAMGLNEVYMALPAHAGQGISVVLRTTAAPQGWFQGTSMGFNDVNGDFNGL